jgi:hypothetical protein
MRRVAAVVPMVSLGILVVSSLNAVEFATPVGCGAKSGLCLPGSFAAGQTVVLIPAKGRESIETGQTGPHFRDDNAECGPFEGTELVGKFSEHYSLAAVGPSKGSFRRLSVRESKIDSERSGIHSTVQKSGILPKLSESVRPDNAVLISSGLAAVSMPTNTFRSLQPSIFIAKYQVLIGSGTAHPYVQDGPSVVVYGSDVQPLGSGCSWMTDYFELDGVPYIQYTAGQCAGGGVGEGLLRLQESKPPQQLTISSGGGC